MAGAQTGNPHNQPPTPTNPHGSENESDPNRALLVWPRSVARPPDLRRGGRAGRWGDDLTRDDRDDRAMTAVEADHLIPVGGYVVYGRPYRV